MVLSFQITVSKPLLIRKHHPSNTRKRVDECLCPDIDRNHLTTGQIQQSEIAVKCYFSHCSDWWLFFCPQKIQRISEIWSKYRRMPSYIARRSKSDHSVNLNGFLWDFCVWFSHQHLICPWYCLCDKAAARLWLCEWNLFLMFHQNLFPHLQYIYQSFPRVLEVQEKNQRRIRPEEGEKFRTGVLNFWWNHWLCKGVKTERESTTFTR